MNNKTSEALRKARAFANRSTTSNTARAYVRSLCDIIKEIDARQSIPAAPVAQEPVAYVTADGERVITAKTYIDAKRDGGAMWSSVRPFTVAAYAAPPAAEQPECGCCGQTGPCDPDCDCAEQPDTVAVPRNLLEEINSNAVYSDDMTASIDAGLFHRLIEHLIGAE